MRSYQYPVRTPVLDLAKTNAVVGKASKGGSRNGALYNYEAHEDEHPTMKSSIADADATGDNSEMDGVLILPNSSGRVDTKKIIDGLNQEANQAFFALLMTNASFRKQIQERQEQELLQAKMVDRLVGKNGTTTTANL